jgi:predicted RNA binding protein YcfA (HicA-like mRNA interferase family)
MTNTITFADLEKLLLRLGFIACDTEDSQRIFRYPSLEILIILPAYEANELVRPIHLTATRKTLIDNGLMSGAAFDGFLEKVPG